MRRGFLLLAAAAILSACASEPPPRITRRPTPHKTSAADAKRAAELEAIVNQLHRTQTELEKFQ